MKSSSAKIHLKSWGRPLTRTDGLSDCFTCQLRHILKDAPWEAAACLHVWQTAKCLVLPASPWCPPLQTSPGSWCPAPHISGLTMSLSPKNGTWNFFCRKPIYCGSPVTPMTVWVSGLGLSNIVLTAFSVIVPENLLFYNSWSKWIPYILIYILSNSAPFLFLPYLVAYL